MSFLNDFVVVVFSFVKDYLIGNLNTVEKKQYTVYYVIVFIKSDFYSENVQIEKFNF